MKNPWITSDGSTSMPGFFHGGLESGEPLRARGLRRLALDEGDARVSLRDEVLGHLARGVEIVDAHARDVFARACR